MNELLIASGLLLAGWALLIALRIPSSIAFLSLLIGQLLASQAGNDLYEFVAGIANINDATYVQIGLLVLPLILTLLFMRNRVVKSKLAIEALPSLFVSALTIILLAPLLPALNDILDTASQNQLDPVKSIIVIAAALSGLLSAWLSYPKAHKPDTKKHK